MDNNEIVSYSIKDSKLCPGISDTCWITRYVSGDIKVDLELLNNVNTIISAISFYLFNIVFSALLANCIIAIVFTRAAGGA